MESLPQESDEESLTGRPINEIDKEADELNESESENEMDESILGKVPSDDHHEHENHDAFDEDHADHHDTESDFGERDSDHNSRHSFDHFDDELKAEESPEKVINNETQLEMDQSRAACVKMDQSENDDDKSKDVPVLPLPVVDDTSILDEVNALVSSGNPNNTEMLGGEVTDLDLDLDLKAVEDHLKNSEVIGEEQEGEIDSGELPEELQESIQSKREFDDESDETQLRKKFKTEIEDDDEMENKSDEGKSKSDSKSKTDDSDTDDDNPSNVPSGNAKNLRRNIRDIISDDKLDANTLAAQREEQQRLQRVQEQQLVIKQVLQKFKSRGISISIASQLGLDQPEMPPATQAVPQGQQPPIRSPMYMPRGRLPLATSARPHAMSKLHQIRMQHPRGHPGPSFIRPQKMPYVSPPQIPGRSFRPGDAGIHDSSESESSEGESESDSDVVLISSGDDDHKKKKEKPKMKIKKSESASPSSSSGSDDDCVMLSGDSSPEDNREDEDTNNSGLHVNDTYNMPDEQGRVLVNMGHPQSEKDVYLVPQIARAAKPHQIGGIRFMYDNVVENLERFDTASGFGCILAHSMGLGKTLQVVAFSEVLLTYTSSRTVLIIVPINTLQNWVAEFNHWLPADASSSPLSQYGEVGTRKFGLHVINDSHKSLGARSKVINDWHKDGGVLLIGYELYRQLSLKKKPQPKKRKQGRRGGGGLGGMDQGEIIDVEEEDRNKELFDDIMEALVKPGPDLVICDEGHRIKNSHASTAQALKSIRTRRRIVLTGYPLQNNLLEYWCMVDFVRPNYLGTKTEFGNMFERPIQNGQCCDSTPKDIKLMRYRAHVLHSLLEGFIQRRSHGVLQASLPKKEEHVLLCRMTDFQRKIYRGFMTELSLNQSVANPLRAFAVCCKIWNHPDVLHNFLKKRQEEYDLELDDVAEGVTNVPATRGRPRGRKPANKPGRKPNQIVPLPTIPPTPANSQQQQNSHMQTLPATVPAFNQTQQNFQQPQPLNFSQSNLNQQTQQSTMHQPQQPLPPTNMHQPQPLPPSNMHQPQPLVPTNMHQPQPLPPSNMHQQSQQPAKQSLLLPQTPSNTPPQTPNPMYSQTQQPLPHFQQIYSPHYPRPPHAYNPNDYPQFQQPHLWTEYPTAPSIPPVMPPPIQVPPTPPQTPQQPLSVVSSEGDGGSLNNSSVASQDGSIPGTPTPKEREEGLLNYDWATTLFKGYIPGLLENSAKVEIFFTILEETVNVGDKLLVFSQSLFTLSLLEDFLQRYNLPGRQEKWAHNFNYFRLDGSTTALEREKLIGEFNCNPNIHLFLISTRAGSLGINLVGANRVLVFDASWNPCHDTQAVCRVYRYGQTKPCYVYRLVTDNCLEKKIYDRQINKQGMSDRVVDEHNPDAHLSLKEVTTLICYDEEDPDPRDWSESDYEEKFTDDVMRKVIERQGKVLTKLPFEHESLLIDRQDKKLSEAEKRIAKRSYELEKQASINYSRPSYSVYIPKIGITSSPQLIPAHLLANLRARGRGMPGMVKPIASVRPMPAVGGIRPNAALGQKQGISTHQLIIPKDVVIPTSTRDGTNITLKAGQKILVIKTPKGVYLRLSDGKLIAVRIPVNFGGDKSKGTGAGLGATSSPGSLEFPKIPSSSLPSDITIKPMPNTSDNLNNPTHDQSTMRFHESSIKGGRIHHHPVPDLLPMATPGSQQHSPQKTHHQNLGYHQSVSSSTTDNNQVPASASNSNYNIPTDVSQSLIKEKTKSNSIYIGPHQTDQQYLHNQTPNPSYPTPTQESDTRGVNKNFTGGSVVSMNEPGQFDTEHYYTYWNPAQMGSQQQPMDATPTVKSTTVGGMTITPIIDTPVTTTASPTEQKSSWNEPLKVPSYPNPYPEQQYVPPTTPTETSEHDKLSFNPHNMYNPQAGYPGFYPPSNYGSFPGPQGNPGSYPPFNPNYPYATNYPPYPPAGNPGPQGANPYPYPPYPTAAFYPNVPMNPYPPYQSSGTSGQYIPQPPFSQGSGYNTNAPVPYPGYSGSGFYGNSVPTDNPDPVENKQQ